MRASVATPADLSSTPWFTWGAGSVEGQDLAEYVSDQVACDFMQGLRLLSLPTGAPQQDLEPELRVSGSDLTSLVELGLNQLHIQGTGMPEPASIRDYLTEHPDMVEPVLALCCYARLRFPLGATLTLVVYRDPEVTDEYLTVYVRLPDYSSFQFEQIKEVERECEPLLEEKSGWLVLTTDFQPVGGA